MTTDNINAVFSALYVACVVIQFVNFIVYQMHLIDYLITLVSVCVCVWVHRLVVERLRPQFFTDFH